MHISEGVLSGPVLAGSAVFAAAGVALGLRRLPDERIALAGLLCAMFFVASLIHVPVGVTSVHLVLNGICGVLLGWSAFPVILVALLLQALLFGFGGLTTLGVNTLVMGVPAVLCGAAFRAGAGRAVPRAAAWRAAALGAGSIALGIGLMAAALWLSGGATFMPLIAVALAGHLPVMIIEALVTGFLVAAIARTRPALLEWEAIR